MAANGDMTFQDIMLDIAWCRIENARDDKREMDNKASILVAANGLLLGLLASAWGNMYFFSALIALSFILWSSFNCLMVLKNREYPDWKIDHTWNELISHKDDILTLKSTIISTINDSDAIWVKNVKEMGDCYHKALIAIGRSMVFVALSLVLDFLSLPSL